MRLAKLLPLLAVAVVAGCTDSATKQESVQIFTAASSALGSAQSRAVDQARVGQLTAPAEVTLDFSGPCTFGGTVALSGNYVGDDNDERAAFDLSASFAGCKEITGTLDGNLQWTSEATAAGFSASLTGDLEWHGNDGDASCGFDLSLTVNDTGIVYGGHLCGYDVRTELVLGN
ncbi:MAG TPA: hypothetical protein VIV40_27620 [Kofleriaceae bacterium]